MHWQHPVTDRHARCQFMVDVGPRASMITVFEETRERSNRNNQTAECKESLLKDWFVHRGIPRLIRMDPDGCYMSNEMLNTLHDDLGLNTEVMTGEAPWKLSITGVIMRLVKRTAHLYALDQGRDASCQECLLQAVMAHFRLLKHGGYTPLQLLFRHVHRHEVDLALEVERMHFVLVVHHLLDIVEELSCGVSCAKSSSRTRLGFLAMLQNSRYSGDETK